MFCVTSSLKTVRNPRRALRLVEARKLYKLRHRLHPPASGDWIEGNGDFVTRGYRSLDDYVAHQRSKLGIIDLADYERTFRPALRDRSAGLPVAWQGQSVICLAARKGTEVRSFTDNGAFAVGIDLNPGKNNPVVLPGDFHHIQFPDHSVDAVYTNSLDHAFDLDKVITEVERVLKPNGVAVIEVVQANRHGPWEATYWSSDDAVADEFQSHGFKLRGREPFDVPWPGVQFLLIAPS